MNKIFLKLISLMKKYANIKTINKINIENYRSLLRKRKRDIINIKLIINKFINIKGKIKYFVSNLFISSSLFFKIPKLKYKYYYKNKNQIKTINCEDIFCNNIKKTKFI